MNERSSRRHAKKKKTKQKKNVEKINAGPAYSYAPILTTQRIHVLAHFYFCFYFLFNPLRAA